MEVIVPNTWIILEPQWPSDIDLLAYPDRPAHRRVKMKRIWFEFCGGRGHINFRATQEEMLEDTLVLLQELLRLNPHLRLTSIWVGAVNVRINEAMALKRKYCRQLNYETFKWEGGGRQILRLKNVQRAFVPLLDNR